MTDTITIRVLGPDDVEVLDRVRPGLFAQDADPVHAWGFLNTGVNALVVGLMAGEVVGFASGLVVLHPDKPRSFQITDIRVHPDLRGKGHGTRLLRQMSRVAEDRGCETLTLWTAPENDAARALCKTLKGADATDQVGHSWDLTRL